jgi:hypothetical protein
MMFTLCVTEVASSGAFKVALLLLKAGAIGWKS